MKYTCIIVDDEKPAQRVLENYIKKLPKLELLKTCNNAIEALSFLTENKTQIIYLDINMPDITGFEMLNTLEIKPLVVICSAYSEFALTGFEYGVVDYLLKPISFERFLKAYNRTITLLKDKNEENNRNVSENEGYITVQDNYKEINVLYSSIYYFESYGNYIKIISNVKNYIMRESMTNLLKKLPPDKFVRVHKSYTVSIEHVKHIKGNLLFMKEHKVPIGNMYKHRIIDLFT